ncbi:MAG: nickel-dependent lactate racemase [Burkholderiaceae bacterium]|nr:nickel-dependent lactate racemase [Burkholderiaceae bacterium]
MAVKSYEYAYGRGTKTFELDDTRVLKEVVTQEFPPMQDIKQGVLDAIYNPIGLEPIDKIIKPGDTVAFICNDLTRVANSYDFMPVLVNEMNKLGVRDEDMHILFSLGTHRNMTHEEMVEAVGEEVAGRLKMYNNECKKEEDFEFFGTTSRGTPVWVNKHLCHVDHVILTGSIVQHYFSGYGGGRKAILPGCTAMETTRVNHSFMLDPNAQLGKMQGNPCYEDQVEGVSLFAKGRSLFLFNAILNAKHEFLRMYAGHYVEAHLEACKFVDQAYGCVIPKKADLVIASCGGFPKDINVYQMQKTMDNAACAVRDGGVVVLLADCEEGSGSKVLEETFRRLVTFEAIRDELKDNFVIGANKAYAVARPMQSARYILVTSLDRQLAKEMHFTAAVDTVAEALAIAKEYVGETPDIVLMPEGSLTVPRVE